MKIESAKKLWAIIKAYAEGKTIEVYSEYYGKWIEPPEPDFNEDNEYRIKSKECEGGRMTLEETTYEKAEKYAISQKPDDEQAQLYIIDGYLKGAEELEQANNHLTQQIKDLQKDLEENKSDCALCYSKDKEQLGQAKEIIKELINIINYLNEDEYGKEDFPIVHKAKQFLKEGK